MTALTLLPLPIIALGLFFILRFWHALDLLGFRDEVLRRDSSLATADLVAICTGSAFIIGTIYGIASDTPGSTHLIVIVFLAHPIRMDSP